MKLTPEQIKRLKELREKDAKDLSDEDKNELAQLEALEKAAKEAVANDPPEDDEEGELTEKELEAIVTKGVETGTKGLKANPEEIADLVVKKLNEAKEGDETLTEEGVKSIVLETIKGQTTKGLTEKDVTGLISKALSEFKKEPAMKHDHQNAGKGGGFEDLEFVKGGSAGNLTVCEKQLLNVLMKQPADTDIPKSLLDKANYKGMHVMERIYRGKAVEVTGDNANIIDSDLSSMLHSRLYGESMLAAELLRTEMEMPTNPYALPVNMQRPRFRLIAEANPAQGTGWENNQTILNAKKLMAKVEYSYELDEDSLIPILPMIMQMIVEEAAASFEDAIINGQNSNDIDDGYDNESAQALFDGFRQRVHENADVGDLRIDLSAGNISALNIAAMRKAMGKYGKNVRHLMILCGDMGYQDFVVLPEVLTDDKHGRGTIHTGDLSRIYNIPIIPSSLLNEEVNSNGVIDANPANNTKSQLLLVYKPNILLGRRRGFTVETDKNKNTQVNEVFASYRRDYQPLVELSAQDPTIVWGTNITV